MCASLHNKLTLMSEKMANHQNAMKISWLENEELSSELAQARSDCRRHAQHATEFRAELVTTKRDLAKQRHAERELQQATDELDVLSAKLGKAQRARDAAEYEVKQGN